MNISGSVLVKGSAKQIDLSFKLQTYKVTFTESNLPSGSAWYVNISNGMKSGSITGSSYSFSLINGSYSYTISTVNRIYHANSGLFQVKGESLSERITFSKVLYTVTFTESNLPAETSWTLVFNGNSYTLTNTSYTFHVINGSYSYHATSTDYMNISGSVLVKGSNKQVNLLFSLQMYALTFNESGLPQGSTWYVNLSNGMKSGAVSGSYYSFTITNGSYSYSISTTDKIYEPNPSSGLLKVNGASVSEPITFSKVLYTVTFKESGLPSGISWYVKGAGSGNAPAGSPITFLLTNGTYRFIIANTTAYYTTTEQFSITMNGRNITETVTYLHYSYITGKISPSDGKVTVNGHKVTLSPTGSLNLSVAAGSYNVIISAKGYRTYYDNITVTNGKSVNITYDLKKISKPGLSPIESIAIASGIIGSAAVIGVVVYVFKFRK